MKAVCSVIGCEHTTEEQTDVEREYEIWLCDIDNNRFGVGSHFTEFVGILREGDPDEWIARKIHGRIPLRCAECATELSTVDYLCSACRGEEPSWEEKMGPRGEVGPFD